MPAMVSDGVREPEGFGNVDVDGCFSLDEVGRKGEIAHGEYDKAE